ncbi:uncharacterized protein LOC111591576 [Ceratitis capitata]|uniref:uncharacterized protein LOC111591576 n=1 Tax=Ceratitis capitata TaxID=7213 RepID=UPI000329EE56|nr:uncharacterized protein LOC111591576 [Ceratitis capitata]
MRLLLLLALLAVAVPSLQQTTNSTTTTATTTTSITSTSTIASTLSCLTRCPRVYRPVCASYNGGRRTYANICLMHAARRCARRRREQGILNIHLLFRGTCRSRDRRRRRRTTRRGLRT